MPIEIKPLTEINDFNQCETLQRLVWGGGDLGITPTHFFVASSHSGGLVLGAFVGAELIGFLNGFPAYLPENLSENLSEKRAPLGFHSDMMAVLPEYRGQGIGKKLKWRQRDWCLARSLSWISWTFDPLQRKNARLNFEHLGVSVYEYRVNEYGELGGSLNGDLPTDRLLAHWDLLSKRVTMLANGVADTFSSKPSYALRSAKNKPTELKLELSAEHIMVATPESLNELLVKDKALALEWRLAVREVMQTYLAKGYIVRRFVDSAYILSKDRQ